MDKIKLLRKLGMSEYEARAYLALARIGPSTVREIVLDSKLPRNKVYEVLQRLEDSGRVESLPVSPKKFRVVNSELFREAVEELNEGVSELIKMVEEPKSKEFKELFWVIKGKKAIEDKLALETGKVEKEILGCNNLSKILYKNIRLMKEAVDRGVEVKLICTFEESKKESYREWLSTGASIRVFDKKKFGPLLPRITVHDSLRARLTTGKPEVRDEEDYITIWTDSKVFALMLRNQFMNMWKECKPIEKYLG